MEKLITVRTEDQLKALSQYLVDKDLIAVDTETTSLSRDSQVVGLSVCVDPEEAYYIVICYWDKDMGALREIFSRDTISKFIRNSLLGHKLIMHNGIFDCSMIEANFGINLIHDLHTDTMVLAHLLDENRAIGLKDLGLGLFGEDSVKEQIDMKESVKANGGLLTKDHYELYKADSELLARYGAKDTILTLKLFYTFVPELYKQGLDKFFYDDESMPLLRGPTYDMNTTGLKVDQERLQNLKGELEAECLELKTYIQKEIQPHVQDKYPGTSKVKTFNIGASQQLAWLLFIKLGQPFHRLTDAGKEVCKSLGLKIPYSFKAKRDFIQAICDYKGHAYIPETKNLKTGKIVKAKLVGDVWKYLSADAEALELYAEKYNWVKKLLDYSKNLKILNTYVIGIQERMKYGVIRPSFNQTGTTSGRYSSKSPNFTNLPRDDKRIKSCIVSRPGKVFVGADYSQLEPRVFAAMSQDAALVRSFNSKEDFYSVIGMEVFDKFDCTPHKEGENAFGVKYKKLRDIAKVVALSSTYGTTAPKMASAIDKSIDEAQEVIDNYFEKFPGVAKFMLDCHEEAKTTGKVTSLFGRPRRMPLALEISKVYGNSKHSDLPYEARNILNLSVNHRVQSTAASVTNRAMIKFNSEVENCGIQDCRIVVMVHDEIVAECLEQDSLKVQSILKESMETTTAIPGIPLIAEPKVAKNLAELK